MRGLYIVTPNWNDTQKLISITQLALEGGAVCVQYRHKEALPELRREQAQALLKLSRSYNVPFVINDFVDLCLELDADGVHVGGTDAAVDEVRKQVGPNKIVGASCYGDLALARDAKNKGASYVAFGGFYASKVKKYPVTTSISILQTAKETLNLPCVVIGGMTVENSAVLVKAGADMVAAISSVYLDQDPKKVAQQFTRLFEQ
jgi:thiamine-phosphate pyrophosphorylase